MDKRSIKTKDTIRINFLNLLNHKDLEDITVSELCQKCNIHRKTFYAHYKNTMEILDELFNELIQDVSNLYCNMLIGAIGNFAIFFSYVNQYILKNLDYYRLLSKTNQYVVFMNKIDEFFAKNILERFDKDFKIYSTMNKYSLYFMISGMTSLYMNWIKNPEQCPITYISDTCVNITNHMFNLK